VPTRAEWQQLAEDRILDAKAHLDPDIKTDRDVDAAANPALLKNWQRLADWSEASRYEQKSQAEAERLFEAVTDPKDGVMQWIRCRW